MPFAKSLKYSFFNVSWSEEQVRAALNFGYKEAIGKGFYHGTYEFTYLGETVYVALDNGVFHTGYGVYHYKIDELKALLREGGSKYVD